MKKHELYYAKEQKPGFENYCFFCNGVVKLSNNFFFFNFDLLNKEAVLFMFYVFK